MKNNLKTLLPMQVPHFCFSVTCAILLALGAAAWVNINQISRASDAGIAVLRLPEPLAMGAIRRAGMDAAKPAIAAEFASPEKAGS